MDNAFALHIALWPVSGDARDGTVICDTGLSVAVSRKHSNGQWLMVLDNPNAQFLMG